MNIGVDFITLPNNILGAYNFCSDSGVQRP
jgi:hypothetical protein